ncbi:LLM class flavin-dependent oxidoreductase [Lacticaseibacillus rhamnosus]
MARKVSISFNWQGPMDYDQALARVRLAEEAGVDTAWVAEAWGRDCFTILALMARETQRMQLGTGIVNTYSRTPAALAQRLRHRYQKRSSLMSAPAPPPCPQPPTAPPPLRALAGPRHRLHQALPPQRGADRGRRRSPETDQRRLRPRSGRRGAQGDCGRAHAPGACLRRGRTARRRRARRSDHQLRQT